MPSQPAQVSDQAPTRRAFDVVISDIDGCLGPESHAPLDAGRLAQVAVYNQRAHGAGDVPVVTLCSGRPQPYAEAMSRLIANRSVPVVCEMGVWLYDPRDNRFLMDPTITPEHLSVIDAATAWIRRELTPMGVVMQPGKAASISLWHPHTPTLLGLLEDPIRARVAREGWPLRVSNTVAWINLELEHVSKGSGIDRLTKMLGLRRERLAGIGDTMGDLAIRERVAFFACPANADERLKAHADYVSPHTEAEGVLDVLHRLSTMA